MKLNRRFSGSHRMADLLNCDYNIIPILSRFGIPLGFGHQTISEVCTRMEINEEVFLLVVNFLLTGKIDSATFDRVTATQVVDFLHNSHEYFLNFKFPHIRKNLLEAFDDSNPWINPAILSFFDNFIEKVKTHFANEERTVFPYVRRLDAGELDPSEDYSIDTFRRSHDDEIETSLNELKNIIMRFYVTDRPDLMYDVLVDLYNVEEDLEKHSSIENHILVPMVTAIENKKL